MQAEHQFAIIDCGTNTFHLLICEREDKTIYPVFRDKVHVKLGQDGIEKGTIHPQAWKRAIGALEYFKMAIDKFSITEVHATATSAIRNAKNGLQLIEEVKEKTGISIKVITGNKEADLIYQGVALAVRIGKENSLVMDIGGGSVEFIACNDKGILWKRSYEIGAQRLLDRFHGHDPILPKELLKLEDFLESQLKDLFEFARLNPIETLIGSSGSFDTIYEIHARKKKIPIDMEDTSFQLSLEGFGKIHRKLITRDKEERLKIPGMAEARVDMIVVASCLIDFILKRLQIKQIKVSSFALKEGIMAEISRGNFTFYEDTES